MIETIGRRVGYEPPIDIIRNWPHALCSFERSERGQRASRATIRSVLNPEALIGHARSKQVRPCPRETNVEIVDDLVIVRSIERGSYGLDAMRPRVHSEDSRSVGSFDRHDTDEPELNAIDEQQHGCLARVDDKDLCLGLAPNHEAEKTESERSGKCFSKLFLVRSCPSEPSRDPFSGRLAEGRNT